jgi:urease accessory protein
MSPLRALTPRNHGSAAWAFLTTLGGGLVDGDRIEAKVAVEARAFALLGTQSSTKVYRSPHGCFHGLDVRVGQDAAVAMVPDPVVCFAGACYTQRINVSLAPGASLLLLDGYTSGRAGRGERWAFARLDSRSTVRRFGAGDIVDSTLLDPAHGAIAERMGRFGAVLTLLAVGPRFRPVAQAMLVARSAPSFECPAVASASPLGDGAVLRVAADRFETASCLLRPSFEALADILGDDPFARKW